MLAIFEIGALVSFIHVLFQQEADQEGRKLQSKMEFKRQVQHRRRRVKRPNAAFYTPVTFQDVQFNDLLLSLNRTIAASKFGCSLPQARCG
jgi:hypothetical protein